MSTSANTKTGGGQGQFWEGQISREPDTGRIGTVHVSFMPDQVQDL